MKEEKNVQINLSFDVVKKALLVVLGLYFLMSLITNIYIDASIGGECKQELKSTICDCITTGLKKTNIFHKISLIGSDIESISTSGSGQQLVGSCIGFNFGAALGKMF